MTINSQPAVNGVLSSDPVHGWGNEGGYVYQRAYLEFFMDCEMEQKLLDILTLYPHVNYHIVNHKVLVVAVGM